jgi:hypothetical protein
VQSQTTEGFRALLATAAASVQAKAHAQDKVDGQRADLIANTEGKPSQKVERRELLAVRWTLT